MTDELWLQHQAGKILFRDVRDFALQKMGTLSPADRAVAERAIDHALYGMMMVADGVTGASDTPRGRVALSLHATFSPKDGPPQALDLLDGDGMCMGFHQWKRGDFGDR